MDERHVEGEAALARTRRASGASTGWRRVVAARAGAVAAAALDDALDDAVVDRRRRGRLVEQRQNHAVGDRAPGHEAAAEPRRRLAAVEHEHLLGESRSARGSQRPHT